MSTIRPLLLFAAAAIGLSSCAVGTTSGPPPQSMSAARAGLSPEYRIFYDTLQDYGDWMLIEPYGYVFRPKVGFRDWRPYEYGFWAPTDAFGWVWISNEPFGWATYHYGRWFYDDFNAWIWQPGAEWAPAWVNWQANGQYVGWSPLMSGGGGNVPGGHYLFAPVSALGSTDLATRVQTQSQLGAAVADARPVNETVEIDGVRVPGGPSVQRIEQILGQRLPRVRVDNLLRQASSSQAPGTAGAKQEATPTLEDMRRAGEQASREARTITTRGGPLPARLSIVRAPVERGGLLQRLAPATRDTVARRPGG